MKNETFNSILFILITLGLIFLLDCYMFPLVNNLFISDGGNIINNDNYVILLINYIIYLLFILLIQILNIKIFMKKSNLLFTVKIPINTIFFINFIIILCFYIFSPMFLWLLILFGIIPILIIIISFIVGITMDFKKDKASN